MKTLLVLFAGAALSLAADPKTFTGVITDTMCGKTHRMVAGQPDDKCVDVQGYCAILDHAIDKILEKQKAE